MIAQFQLTDLHEIEEEPGCLKGTVEIFGVPHHLWLVQVDDVKDEVLDHETQQGVGDPCERYDEISMLNGGEPLEEVQVPGYPGRKFVAVIYPYAK